MSKETSVEGLKPPGNLGFSPLLLLLLTLQLQSLGEPSISGFSAVQHEKDRQASRTTRFLLLLPPPVCGIIAHNCQAAIYPYSVLVVADSNPLLSDWDANQPFGLPPFSAIGPEHFRPAFDTALAKNLAEIGAIASNPEPATFANTAVAVDRSGALLTRVSHLFSNLCSSNTRFDTPCCP